MKMDIKSNVLDIIMAWEIDSIAMLHNDYLKLFWLHLQSSSDLQNYRNYVVLGGNKISDAQRRTKAIQGFSKRYWLPLALLQ